MINSKGNSYIQACPVGCKDLLEDTDIILHEGCLLRCKICGQLVSQCSQSQYQQSMNEFDNPEGTLPGCDSMRRHFQRTSKWLRQIAARLNKPNNEIHLLDVGCSSGAFL